MTETDSGRACRFVVMFSENEILRKGGKNGEKKIFCVFSKKISEFTENGKKTLDGKPFRVVLYLGKAEVNLLAVRFEIGTAR